MTNTQVVVVLIYADSSQFIVGGFPNMAAAQAWVTTEKTRPYWASTTQVQLTDFSTTPPTVTVE